MERVQRLLNHIVEFHFIKDDKEGLPKNFHFGFAQNTLKRLSIMFSYIVVIVVFEKMLFQSVFVVQIL
jgi:hypothetical protein